MPTSAPSYSDQALASEVAARDGDDWRYVSDIGLWLRWQKTYWQPDLRNAVATPIAAICCENASRATAEGERKNLIRSLASEARNRAVLNRLSRDQRLVVTHDQLDADKMSLGTPAGRVDLRTGELLTPDRANLITMVTSVAPAPKGTPCPPVWRNFLNTTYPLVPGKPEPDQEFIDYLQTYSGYCLCGEVIDHSFAFLLGRGRNGKGVCTHTFQNVMGDYASVINPETLMERHNEPHRAELAVIRGKRLLLCREISPGQHWNYSRLMALVSGDPIQANLMRQNPFTFKPCGKLLVEANNRPVFRVVTDAVRGRFYLWRHEMRFFSKDKLVAGDATIVERDANLEQKLVAEYPAILRWMIDGCVKWHKEGFVVPQKVLDDSDDYLEDQDEIGTWIRECCTTVIGGGSKRKDLFESWTLWRLDRREKPTDYREFGANLVDHHGFTMKHQSYGDQVVGLALNDFARAAVLNARQQKENAEERRGAYYND
jgi:putative DNA primase/helicase